MILSNSEVMSDGNHAGENFFTQSELRLGTASERLR
jgi:hypothetical protein